jgi:hypothetical protein
LHVLKSDNQANYLHNGIDGGFGYNDFKFLIQLVLLAYNKLDELLGDVVQAYQFLKREVLLRNRI